MEDFPGMGAERARKMREPTMFRRPKITDPDLGDKFDRMMGSLDLDEPEPAEDPYEPAAFSREEIRDIQQGMYGKRR